MSVQDLLVNINNEDKTVPTAIAKVIPQIEKERDCLSKFANQIAALAVVQGNYQPPYTSGFAFLIFDRSCRYGITIALESCRGDVWNQYFGGTNIFRRRSFGICHPGAWDFQVWSRKIDGFVRGH